MPYIYDLVLNFMLKFLITCRKNWLFFFLLKLGLSFRNSYFCAITWNIFSHIKLFNVSFVLYYYFIRYSTNITVSTNITKMASSFQITNIHIMRTQTIYNYGNCLQLQLGDFTKNTNKLKK